ncbi:PAS domain-containing sensor histidine kinase [Neobacillus soli]|nr:PAS domain-containing sensor histidine kinase [Neobacillus soli]
MKIEKRILLKRYLDESIYGNPTLFTGNQDAIFVLDLDGCLVEVNPAFEDLSEYIAEESRQLNLQMLFPNEKSAKAFHFFQKALLGQFQNFDCKMTNKTGRILDLDVMFIPISVNNQIVGVSAVVKDITHLKRRHEEVRRMEEEAKKREETYRNLVEYSPDAVIIARGKEILFINETGVRLLGATKKEDILFKKILDIVHPDFYEAAQKRMNIATSGEATDFYEYKLIRLDGTIFAAEVKGIPTIYQNMPARYIIFRDITTREKTLELLLNAEKLHIAGQLAAGIAHEVRNPLTVIKGFLQLMETQLDNKLYFDIIQAEMDRIELILSELLVLAKPQDFKFEKEDLKTLIEDVKTLIGTEASMNNVQIDIVNEYKNLIVKCDKNQLKQVLINFLKNAIEAMPKGGFITIEVKKHSISKVKMLIKDTGSGMPQHILKRIGEPFFTTKESGTGLGIMISKQIIENHNGSIHFWSDQKGTIIEMILPTT